MMSDEEKDPCAYCPYGSKAMDPVGHDYYQCDLDDDPDDYLDARCTTGGDD